MAEIAVNFRSEASDRRCPWCHEGEIDDGPWVVCERDQTPIHVACLEEYGTCPICREAISVSDSASSRLSVAELPQVPGLDDELRAFIEAIKGSYAPRWTEALNVVSVFAGLICAIVLWPYNQVLAVIVFLASFTPFDWLTARLGKPRPSVWSEGRSGAKAPELALQIAEGDREALARPEQFFAARRAVIEANRALVRWERRAREARVYSKRVLASRRRLELRQRTTLEEARRIRGIGPEAVEALKKAGIRNLADLSEAGALDRIPGIDEQQARLVRSWAELREQATERLLAGRPEPEVSVDPELARERSALVECKQAAIDEAEACKAAIERWRSRRPRLIKELEEKGA